VWGSAPQTAKVWAPAWADIQTNAMLAFASGRTKIVLSRSVSSLFNAA